MGQVKCREELEERAVRALLKNYHIIKMNLIMTEDEKLRILKETEFVQFFSPEHSSLNQRRTSLAAEIALLRIQWSRLEAAMKNLEIFSKWRNKNGRIYAIIRDKYLINRPLNEGELREKYGYETSQIYRLIKIGVRELGQVIFYYSTDEEIENTLRIIRKISGEGDKNVQSTNSK